MLPMLVVAISLPPTTTTTLGEGVTLGGGTFPAETGLGGDMTVFTGEFPEC
jgi:hypothetical protein